MATITVNYGALTAGHDGLVATWGRIEGHLAELETVVGGTADMNADALRAFVALKQRWSAAAEERQAALQALARLVKQAGDQYRAVDTAMAAQFT
jgi:uncharacterized protein YukE